MKQRHFRVRLTSGSPFFISSVDIDIPIIAENGLSFIETSALDASNVEVAFQNILTGQFLPSHYHSNFMLTKEL